MVATVGLLAGSIGMGCTGHASVHMIPRGMKKISTTESLVVRIKPRECYFWINDDQKLCVAMRDASRIPLGRLFAREALLSFVLGSPPASAARNYRVDRRTLRVRMHAGLTHVRSASLSGIFAVWDYERTRLRGRFRVTVKQQSYSSLTGWRGNRRVLLVGEFTAVRNRDGGEMILEKTEENGMSRAASARRPPPARLSAVKPDRFLTGAARIRLFIQPLDDRARMCIMDPSPERERRVANPRAGAWGSDKRHGSTDGHLVPLPERS